MTPEIILMIIGIVIIVASIIFAGSTGKQTDDGSFFTDEDIDDKKVIIEEVLKKKTEEIVDNAIIDADDKLSALSNEKIMAMNEFYETNLAKINENHDHVVFLYNMLNAKDEEIKTTLTEMQNAKADLKDTVMDVVRITKQLNNAVKKGSVNVESKPAVKKASEERKPSASDLSDSLMRTVKGTADYKTSSTEMADEASGQMSLPGMMQSDNKTEEILRMYKSGRSILDISKTLKLGQGEVKLVIDLYGA